MNFTNDDFSATNLDLLVLFNLADFAPAFNMSPKKKVLEMTSKNLRGHFVKKN